MQWMRAEFEIPADRGYVLGDLFVRGIPLEFGGQLAGLFSLIVNLFIYYLIIH